MAALGPASAKAAAAAAPPPGALEEAAAVSVAAIIVDAVVPAVIVHVLGHSSASLTRWYRTLGASAVAMDVLSMIWGTLPGFALSRRLAPRLLAALALQIVHDVAFGALVLRHGPAGGNRLLALFAEYAREHGAWILLIDAVMMACVVAVAHARPGARRPARALVRRRPRATRSRRAPETRAPARARDPPRRRARPRRRTAMRASFGAPPRRLRAASSRRECPSLSFQM